VRHYASIENAFTDLQKLQQSGQKARAVYVHDLIQRIKLLAPNTWFALDAKGQLSAFLQKDAATAYAAANKGRVLDFAGAQAAVKASL
jgi:NitT/TauT family transport system substrate-binding protein